MHRQEKQSQFFLVIFVFQNGDEISAQEPEGNHSYFSPTYQLSVPSASNYYGDRWEAPSVKNRGEHSQLIYRAFTELWVCLLFACFAFFFRQGHVMYPKLD